MLVSGHYDRAMAAFQIATGFQAMGMQMSTWFVLFGTTCLRKPRSRWSLGKWFGRLRPGPGRVPETDTALQHLMRGMTPEGAPNIPLSQLDVGGLGRGMMNRVMRRKGIASLPALIELARDLGVEFTVCQVCVDTMAIGVPDDLVVPARVRGVSEYFLDASCASYNVTL
jgi:peroxiredoxin family protein